MRDVELRWIKEQAVKCSFIVEIGSHQGRSTRAWYDHMQPGGRIICIDPWIASKDGRYYHGESDYTCFRNHMMDGLAAGRVSMVRGTSDEAVLIMEPHKGQVDLVFIDGDHSGPAVARDIKNYLPLVRPGGIISGHDYDQSHSGLRRAVDKAFGKQNVKLTESKTQAIWWVQL
jgi:predicted O-methyltransferase YrrM